MGCNIYTRNIYGRKGDARLPINLRFKDVNGIYCNSQMTTRMLKIYCKLNDESISIMKNAMERLNLSARAYDRILKVARTIADLENCMDIKPEHIAEAIHYRSLDRASWGGDNLI